MKSMPHRFVKKNAMDKFKSKMQNILMLLIVNKNNSYLQQLRNLCLPLNWDYFVNNTK